MGVPSIQISRLEAKVTEAVWKPKALKTGERPLDFLGGAFLKPLCSMYMAYLLTFTYGTFGVVLGVNVGTVNIPDIEHLGKL